MDRWVNEVQMSVWAVGVVPGWDAILPAMAREPSGLRANGGGTGKVRLDGWNSWFEWL